METKQFYLRYLHIRNKTESKQLKRLLVFWKCLSIVSGALVYLFLWWNMCKCWSSFSQLKTRIWN